jgi:hypothetical protein
MFEQIRQVRFTRCGERSEWDRRVHRSDFRSCVKGCEQEIQKFAAKGWVCWKGYCV